MRSASSAIAINWLKWFGVQRDPFAEDVKWNAGMMDDWSRSFAEHYLGTVGLGHPTCLAHLKATARQIELEMASVEAFRATISMQERILLTQRTRDGCEN